MKTFHILASLSAAVSFILTACGGGGSQARSVLDEIKRRGYLVVSSESEYPPQSFLNTAGTRPSDTKCPPDQLTMAEMQGFDVDVAIAIGDHLGVETCFVTPNWETVTAGSWADKWDVSVGSMTITTERQELFDFSVPYYYTPAVVAVLKDSGITALNQLAGQAICAGDATTYETWLQGKDLGPNITVTTPAPEGITIVSLETDQFCAEALVGGQADFVAYSTAVTVVDANIAAGFPVMQVGEPVFYERLAAAFDKTSSLPTDTLRDEVDKLFNAMHTDGRLSELSLKWFKNADGDPVDYTVEG